MNGRSGVRLQLADFLVQLLNRNALPPLPRAATDAEVLSCLADACLGGHDGGDGGSAVRAALEQAGLQPPGLSAAEATVLAGGACASAGVGSLVVQGAKTLLKLATAVTALSCEALGVAVGAPLGGVLPLGLVSAWGSQSHVHCVPVATHGLVTFCIVGLEPAPGRPTWSAFKQCHAPSAYRAARLVAWSRLLCGLFSLSLIPQPMHPPPPPPPPSHPRPCPNAAAPPPHPPTRHLPPPT